MVVAPAFAPPVEPASDAPGHSRADERLAALRELGEIGMVLARGVKRQALALEAAAEAALDDAPAPPRSASELTLDFARVARAVQRSLALEARLEDEREGGAKARAEAAAERASAQEEERLARKRREVKEIVKRGIAAEIAEFDDDDLTPGFCHQRAKSLRSQCDDWLEDEGNEDLDALPVGEIVGLVCEDLGIAFDPDLWREAAPAAPARLSDPTPSSGSVARLGMDSRDQPGQDDEDELQDERAAARDKGGGDPVPPRPP